MPPCSSIHFSTVSITPGIVVAISSSIWCSIVICHCIKCSSYSCTLANGQSVVSVSSAHFEQLVGPLTIGQGTGVGGTFDAMADHNGASYTTRDRDHDTWSDANCAKVYGGAWWHKSCFSANLNGKYVLHTPEDYSGSYVLSASRLSWSDGSDFQHYTKVQMKIRPKRCSSIAGEPTCT